VILKNGFSKHIATHNQCGYYIEYKRYYFKLLGKKRKNHIERISILILVKMHIFGIFGIVLSLSSVTSFINRPFSIQYMNGNKLMDNRRYYPVSRYEYEKMLHRLNIKNTSAIMGDDEKYHPLFTKSVNKTDPELNNYNSTNGIRIILSKNLFDFEIPIGSDSDDNYDGYADDEEENIRNMFYRKPKKSGKSKKSAKSDNFQVVYDSGLSFADIGGYDIVKQELAQIIDILKNHTKYTRFNVRVPKGLIFEGPPGNGKTMLAKALANSAETAFIAVSGSEFQQKYVGEGSGRVRELFDLAKDNVPCIIFIDEIDAIGRARGSDSESASAERDNTLNELLVGLDGFKNSTGVFLIGATNRADLLDPALLRPGRVDKRIFIGNPDANTRAAILAIHIKGKPHDLSVVLTDLVEYTNGLSGAQIENILNEAMLHALRHGREAFNSNDIDMAINRILVGWQPTEHQFNDNMIDRIAIHELGHAFMGLISKYHAKMTKVMINLSAPNTPAYTVFETSTESLYTKEALFEHLMILLSGHIAEEIFFNGSVTTGATNDFSEAHKLAHKMVVYYGMGKRAIYPSESDVYKGYIDKDITRIIDCAYGYAKYIIEKSRPFIRKGADILKRDKVIKSDVLIDLMKNEFPELFDIEITYL